MTLKIARDLRKSELYGLFRTYIIFGQQGVGKSTYALKGVYHYYRFMKNLKPETAWKRVFDCLAFTFGDVEAIIERAKEKGRRPIIIWDDAGLHASAYDWYEERDYYIALTKYWNVIRTDCLALILTTPMPSMLPAKIRETVGVVLIKVVRAGYTHGRPKAVAEAVEIDYDHVAGCIFRRPIFRDHFIVTLPDDVYERYQALRERYAAPAFEQARAAARRGGRASRLVQRGS